MIVFMHIPKTGGTTFREEVLEKAYPDKVWMPSGDGQIAWSALAMTDSELAAIAVDGFDVATGHLPYTLRGRFSKEEDWVTIIRDPVQRTLSHYFQIVGQTGWEAGWTPDVDRVGIMDNLMVRMLTGKLFERVMPLDIDEAEILLLTKFHAVSSGVAELCEKLDLPVHKESHRVASWRPRGHLNMPERIYDQAIGLNVMDMELYRRLLHAGAF